MYNLEVIVNVIPMPDPNFEALNNRPFHESVFNRTDSLIWTHIKVPLNDN